MRLSFFELSLIISDLLFKIDGHSMLFHFEIGYDLLLQEYLSILNFRLLVNLCEPFFEKGVFILHFLMNLL